VQGGEEILNVAAHMDENYATFVVEGRKVNLKA
jgi:hypothetical protein